MYFHSSYPFFVKVMSSSENIWAVFGIQHICNIAMHKFPIYCLYRIHKRSQRDNIYNSKRFYGASEKYVTPQNFGSGVFFYIKCDRIYYNS